MYLMELKCALAQAEKHLPLKSEFDKWNQFAEMRNKVAIYLSRSNLFKAKIFATVVVRNQMKPLE